MLLLFMRTNEFQVEHTYKFSCFGGLKKISGKKELLEINIFNGEQLFFHLENVSPCYYFLSSNNQMYEVLSCILSRYYGNMDSIYLLKIIITRVRRLDAVYESLLLSLARFLFIVITNMLIFIARMFRYKIRD